MGEIRVLTQRGDERIEWDPADAEQTRAARARFKELKDQGYNFYETVETKGRKVERFTKTSGKLIAAPGARSSEDKVTGRRPRAMAGGPLARTASLR